MKIKEIDFTTIEYVWRTKLWVGRTSVIESYSAMMFMHDVYDASFAHKSKVFLAGYIEDQLVAVNSCHLSESYMARSRGLWVDPVHRGKGYGSKLLVATNAIAVSMGAEAIWSFPRQSSIRTYEAAGYQKTSSWLNHGEFGPNCYALAVLQK